MVVLLPAPLGPTYPKTSPVRTSRSIPRTASIEPKCLTSPWIRMAGRGAAAVRAWRSCPSTVTLTRAGRPRRSRHPARREPNRLNLPGTIQPNAVDRWATQPRSLTTAVRFHALGVGDEARVLLHRPGRIARESLAEDKHQAHVSAFGCLA